MLIPPNIKDEMRALKATGMTANDVRDEIERQHGIRPGRANAILICKGIAPQKPGPRKRSEYGDALKAEILSLIRDIHDEYREKLSAIRMELIKSRDLLLGPHRGAVGRNVCLNMPDRFAMTISGIQYPDCRKQSGAAVEGV